MKERVKYLRTQSRETHPSLSLERARLVTEAYSKYEGTVSIPVLRALTFKYLMENKKIIINKGELIVGERGPTPRATPTYPELCCHTLEDMHIINDRDRISFSVSKESKEIQDNEIIPNWRGRSIRDRIFEEVSDEWKQCYETAIFTEFMEQRAPGHTVAGNKIYRKGMYDLIEEIDEQIDKLDHCNDPEAYDKDQQLKAMRTCAEAITSFAKRYSRFANDLAEHENDPKRRRELQEIARITNKVPGQAPDTFWEALQSYWFIHLGVITELNTWDSFCPGRLDQHLNPFYQYETQNDLINEEEARELLQCFWIKFNNQPAPPKVGVTLEESGTYTDFANINIGGMKLDGSDGVNDVSYLLLEVIEEMQLTQPSSNIQLSKKSPDLFAQKAAKVIRKGFGQPSVFNADAVVTELLRQGKDIIDARCGGTSGCVETGAFGKEAYILTGYFNLTKILEITLNNGFDPQNHKQIGIKTGKAEDFESFEQLLAAYKEQIEYFIDIKIEGNHIIENIYATEMPSPFLSLIIDDCIKNGRDYNAGGARYNTNYIQGVGIGTITDSLTAIKHHVFERHNFTMSELQETLNNNFEGNEPTRQLLMNRTPRYGNDDDAADELMTSVFDMFYNAVEGRDTVRGGTYRINMLPTTCHVYFGSVIGATPEGRKAGLPLSEGISPVQGADKNGPTAIVKSAAKMDHIRTGGTLLNQKFTPQVLENEGLEKLVSLIRSYFRMDGHHIQFNVVSADTLRDAQKKPEEYRNLIVRVAGYSDYFNHLSKELQDEIIQRTEHMTF